MTVVALLLQRSGGGSISSLYRYFLELCFCGSKMTVLRQSDVTFDYFFGHVNAILLCGGSIVHAVVGFIYDEVTMWQFVV